MKLFRPPGAPSLPSRTSRDNASVQGPVQARFPKGSSKFKQLQTSDFPDNVMVLACPPWLNPALRVSGSPKLPSLRVSPNLFHFCHGSPPPKSPVFPGLVTRVTGVTA